MIKYLFLIFALSLPLSLYSISYTYRMTIGTNVSSTVYWTEPYPDVGFIKVYATNESEIYDAYCLANFETIRWLYVNKKNDTEILSERKNNLLFFSGKIRGNEIQRVAEIDSGPVFQTISYSLSEFLKTDQARIRFWFVIPGDYTPVKMVAYREEKDIVKVNGVAVESYCVRLTFDGPLRAFWHSYYWFRTFDYVYVKYEGINGGPGTPETIVELIEEN